MKFIQRNRPLIIGLATVVMIGGFLAFRPDKLFVDDAVSESLADAFTDPDPIVLDTTTTVPVEEDQAEPPVAIPDPVPVPEPTETTIALPDPIAAATGGFYGIDHSATGTATIYEQDGEYVLRLEDDTDIQNGPDLYVWLLPAGDFDGGDPVDYLDLGTLKGNIGGQNYQLPTDFDPNVHQTVLIWCLRFGVPFAAAPLS
ncbi:MAG: DM13 domain-containing protein [Acidimicrobiia bacterium]|nr:DM13 domain-containing protein [Acidimicrobiia bacterium]